MARTMARKMATLTTMTTTAMARTTAMVRLQRRQGQRQGQRRGLRRRRRQSADDSGRIAIITVFLCCRRLFFSAGSGKLAILASQLHAQVISPCNCFAKTASSPQQWGNNNIAGVDLGLWLVVRYFLFWFHHHISSYMRPPLSPSFNLIVVFLVVLPPFRHVFGGRTPPTAMCLHGMLAI